ncbi:Os04g0124233 [Oryza sativa Japonica Group]|uniref:Os04g0124233 protein n=1 Tax=Oryza sativa subsp. japonica TaxID=39947 RepID=A0A0N7KIH9_ORYSJ|nr:Os04g0124233 [Oryza sativa Japonica Group]
MENWHRLIYGLIGSIPLQFCQIKKNTTTIHHIGYMPLKISKIETIPFLSLFPSSSHAVLILLRSIVNPSIPAAELFHRRQAPSLPPSSPPPSSLAATELLRRRQAPSLAVAEPPTAELPAPPPRLELLDLRYFTVDLSPDHITKVKSTGHCCSAFDVCVAKTW